MNLNFFKRPHNYDSFLFVCDVGVVKERRLETREQQRRQAFFFFSLFFQVVLCLLFVCLFHAVKPLFCAPDCFLPHFSQKLQRDCDVL